VTGRNFVLTSWMVTNLERSNNPVFPSREIWSAILEWNPKPFEYEAEAVSRLNHLTASFGSTLRFFLIVVDQDWRNWICWPYSTLNHFRIGWWCLAKIAANMSEGNASVYSDTVHVIIIKIFSRFKWCSGKYSSNKMHSNILRTEDWSLMLSNFYPLEES
jgi:hypothetical protein